MIIPETVVWRDPSADEFGVRSFKTFQECGLLWLLNTTALHPHGFSLAFCWEEGKDPNVDEPYGWKLTGNGSEAWVMPDDEQTDRRFKAIQALFAEQRSMRSTEGLD